uniref:Glutaredoxin domain-containing protein n=1 Tax=Triticum urartu TaxID=4572 RepID=A0A8R7UTH2_TRIUA
MYQAIPYSASRLPACPQRSKQAEAEGAAGHRRAGSRLADAAARGNGGEAVRRAVAESLVLVVGRRGCCLSHVVKRLVQGLGVNPAMHEVTDEAELAAAVAGNAGGEASGVRRWEDPRRARSAHGRAHLRRARGHTQGRQRALAVSL